MNYLSTAIRCGPWIIFILRIHGPGARRPAYLDPEVELLVGDVRDPDAVQRALKGVDAVFHLAASVGVGQSMYQISSYTSANCLGTATLLQAKPRSTGNENVLAHEYPPATGF